MNGSERMPEHSPAEELREAARLMRERGRRALADLSDFAWTAGPTIDPDNNGWYVALDYDVDGYDTTVAQLPYDYEGDTAQHVASWHPTVALAVADVLDAFADGHPLCDGKVLTVARAYLGSA